MRFLPCQGQDRWGKSSKKHEQLSSFNPEQVGHLATLFPFLPPVRPRNGQSVPRTSLLSDDSSQQKNKDCQ